MNIYFNSSFNIRNRERYKSYKSYKSYKYFNFFSPILVFFICCQILFVFLLSRFVFFLLSKFRMNSKSRISPTLAFHYSAVASAALSAALSAAKSNFLPRACLAALRIAIILVMSSGLPKPNSLPKSDNSISLIRV